MTVSYKLCSSMLNSFTHYSAYSHDQLTRINCNSRAPRAYVQPQHYGSRGVHSPLAWFRQPRDFDFPRDFSLPETSPSPRLRPPVAPVCTYPAYYVFLLFRLRKLLAITVLPTLIVKSLYCVQVAPIALLVVLKTFTKRFLVFFFYIYL